MEVEWKYLLKLHPDDSQRPKPSANAKPLPEHLKESDASLDINNRTDGVPDMGDAFHDPHSEHKWAEWHTAPQVSRQMAKVDLSKEDQLWYYLGKSSTEAKPQYTENPVRPRNNPKSHFLDTVKPPPPPVPAFHRAAYPATYALKPAPIAIPPRTPMQQSSQSTRPYQYRPKEPVMNTWKSPMYSADTKKNPNSPVAHQPNVSYDHRLPPSPYTQAAYQGYHSHRSQQQQQQQSSQQYQYHPYIPPQSYAASTAWKTPSSTVDPNLQNAMGHCAHAPQHNKSLPPYPYSQSLPGLLPPSSYAHGPGQQSSASPFGPMGHATAQLTTQAGPHGRSSISSLMSNPSGTPKPPKYAITPSTSSIIYAAQSPTEYLTYVMKYPYLRNAYLRRTKTYISPYSPDGGGISQEWMSKQPQAPRAPPAIKPAPPHGMPTSAHHGYHSSHNNNHSNNNNNNNNNSTSTSSNSNYASPQPAGFAAPRPSVQFQSPDAFQREMARSTQPAEAPKWEQMLKQLATSTGSGPTGMPSATAATAVPEASAAPGVQARHPPPEPPSSGLTYESQKSRDVQCADVGALALGTMQRPTPSPIRDEDAGGAGGGDGGVGDDAGTSSFPPAQDAETQRPGAETWRYS